jgi:hypothetical protein
MDTPKFEQLKSPPNWGQIMIIFLLIFVVAIQATNLIYIAKTSLDAQTKQATLLQELENQKARMSVLVLHYGEVCFDPANVDNVYQQINCYQQYATDQTEVLNNTIILLGQILTK